MQNTIMYTKYFEIGHVTFSIVSGSLPLLDAIGGWLDDFEVTAHRGSSHSIQVELHAVEQDQPLPVKPPAEAVLVHESNEAKYYTHNNQWIVEGKKTGISMVDRSRLNIVAYVHPAYLLESLWNLENFMHPLVELMRQQGLYICHSAGVSLEGCGLLLAGKSGQGKSTLSVDLLNNGFSFLADDRVFLREADGGFEMIGFYEPVKLFASNISHIPALHQSDVFKASSSDRKNDVDMRLYYPETMKRSSELKGVVFPVWSPGQKSQIESVGPGKALLELLPLTLVCFDRDTSKAHFGVLAKLVQLPAVKLIMGGDRENWHKVVLEFIARIRGN